MTRQYEFIPKCSKHVTFSHAWFSHGDDIDRVLEESPRFESLDLELEGGGEPLEIESSEGFLQRQARSTQEPFCPSFLSDSLFLFGDASEFETIQNGFEILMTIQRVRHRPSLRME